MSTKLVLLVVVPLVLTLAVTLPLTVTGLNRLASETSAERLEEEVRIIEERFDNFQLGLIKAADEISANPILLAVLQESNVSLTISNLMSMGTRLGFDHMEVVNGDGVTLGHQHQDGGIVDRGAMEDLNALGLAGLEENRMIPTAEGWFLAVVRPLKNSNGFIGAISFGKNLGVEMLADLNFGRSDPLVFTIKENGEVAFATYPLDHRYSITVDPKSVESARSGRIALGYAMIDGTKQRAAYAPLGLGGRSVGVFSVVLTSSPVMGIRDQLIANHVMVTAALALLVLGVGYMVTRTITQRILRLRDGAIEIANGNLSVRVEEIRHDEMGTLAHEFNRMADSLNEKTSQLEQANRNLEMRVHERTEQLEGANAQLIDAQVQVVRTEKLAAIGAMSAGVAHDLRNPLGAIRNGVYFLKARLVRSDRITTDPKVAEFLDIMDERITQCDKIIGDLISFTRISAPTYSAVDLDEALENAFWGVETQDGISLTKNYGDEEVVVRADMNQLVRVFTNLIVNAHEAMLDGGALTIGVKKVRPSAEVTVTDTGVGMSVEELEKIFDPLYTTKVQGTGLGLAVCQQIIGKHNGELDVSSKVGVGTIFTVRLPLMADG